MYGLRRWFRNQKVAKSITIVLFLAVLYGVAFAVYSFFKWQFGLIAQDMYLRVALPLFYYEGLFLVVFLLVFVSSFITAIFALFRGGQADALVMSSPKFSMVFWRAYRRTLFSAAWPLIVITIPAFLGSVAVFPVSFWGGVLSVLSVLFLAGISASLAVMLFFVCACGLGILAHYLGRIFLGFGKAISLSLLFMAAGLVFVWQRVGIGDITAIFAPMNAAWSASRIDIIFSRFGVFPSHIVTLTLFNAQQGSFAVATIATAGLAAMFGLCLLGMRILTWGFLPLWQSFQEGRYEAKTVSTEKVMRTHGAGKRVTFPRYFKSPLGALFEKEEIVLFRGMKSALWFFFLLVLWMMQVVLEFFIRGALMKSGAGSVSTLAVVEALQLVTAVYFVSAFVLRFVLPAFSGEARTAWILGAAPLRMQSVFWTKFFFYLSIFLLLGVVFCGFNFLIIQTAVIQGFAFAAFALLMIVFIVTFGLGLGAIFPNFDSDDPEVVSTSLPGLGFIFGSLFYGGAGAYLFYGFLMGSSTILALVGFDALTILLGIAVIELSLYSLRKFEFVRDF
jgi:ABC-2 type transport system permease protein